VTAGLQSHSDRISVHGSIILVPAKKAQTLALVIHELATNAAKYGSLSVPTGRVEVAWVIVNDQFTLKWSEIDGPPAQAPANLGFGSIIITSVIGSELGCEPTLSYRQTGLQYQLVCSFRALTAV
jgi:two-component sensor histidine kinase